MVAANDVVQNPESVGTALKTLTMYIRAAKTEAEEAGISTDGMAESVASLQKELLALTGVDIMIDDDTFKSTYQILEEISEVWDNLSDVSQANVLNMLGGKRNANVLSSIIANFEDARKAMETAANSSGSAWAENEKYLNSIEGKTKQLQASFEAMANAVINSDLVKAFVDIGRAVADAVTWLQKMGLLLPTIVGLATTLKTLSSVTTATNAANSILAIIGGEGNTESKISRITAEISQLGTVAKQLAGTKILGGLADQTIDDDLASKVGDIAREMQNASMKTLTFDGVLTAVKTRLAGLGQGLKTFIGSSLGKWTLGITGAIALYNVAKNAYDNYINSLIEGAEKTWSEHQNIEKTASENKKALENLSEEFETLREGVDRYGNNVSLTDDQYDRYLSLCKDIISITPSLKDAYNEKGSSLKTGYITILDEAIKKQQEFLDNDTKTTVSGAPQVLAGWSAEINKSGNDVTSSMEKIVFDVLKLHTDGAQRAGDVWREALYEIGAENIFDIVGADVEKANLDNVYKLVANWEKVEQRFRDAGFADEEISKLQTMTGPLTDFFNTYQEKLKGTVELFQLSASYLDQTKSLWNVIAKEGQDDVFQSGLFSVLSPTASYEENLAATTDYLNQMVFAIYEVNDLRKQLADNEDFDIETAWDELYDRFGQYPAIIGMIRDALFGATEASQENAAAVEKQTKSYEQLAASMDNISKATSFLNSLRSDNKDTFSLIKSAQEFIDMYNGIFTGEGEQIDLSSMFSFDEDGMPSWDTNAVEIYTEAIVRAAFADTTFAQENPEVVDALVAEATAFQNASKAAVTFADATSQANNIASIRQDIDEFLNGDGTDADRLNIISEIDTVIEKWNELGKARAEMTEGGEEWTDVTLQDFFGDGLDNMDLAKEKLLEFGEYILDVFSNEDVADDSLIELLRNVMTAMGEAEEKAYSLSDAMSALSSVSKFLTDGFDTTNPLSTIDDALGVLESWNAALKAVGQDGSKSLADLIVIGDSGEVSEKAGALRQAYIDIANAAIDANDKLTEVEKSALKAQVGDWVSATLDAEAVKEKTEEIEEAFGKIKDIMSYMSDLSDYREGKIGYFEMLENMYDLVEKYDDIKLEDLWDFDSSSFKDIGDLQLDKMLDRLATELAINEHEVEDWKNHVKASFKEAEEAVSEYETASKSISLAGSMSSFMGDLQSGDKDMLSMLSSAVSLAEELGVKLEDIVSVGSDGKLTFETTHLTDAFNTYIDNLVTAGKLNQDLAAQIKNAAKAEGELVDKSAEAAEHMADMLSKMQSLYSFAESGTTGETDILSVLKSAQEQFASYSEDLEKGIVKSPLSIFDFIDLSGDDVKENVNTAKKIYGEYANELLDAWIAETKRVNAENGADVLAGMPGIDSWANGLTGEQAAAFEQIRQKIMDELDKIGAEVEPTVGDIISNLQSLTDFQAKSGEIVDFSTVFDDLENLKRILGDESLTLNDIIKWEDGDFKYLFNKTDLLSDKINEFATQIATELVDAEIAAGNAMDASLRDDEIARRAESIKASLTGVTNAWSEMSNATSKVKAFQGLKSDYQSYQAGETSFLDMLSSTISLAEDLGISLDDAFSVDSSGELIVNIDTMENGLIGVIDNLEAAGACSATLASQLRDAARAEAEVASKAERLQRASENALAAVSFGNGRQRAQQLTYEDYRAMVERDARYAESVEYVNGVLSVNRDKYNEVADAIARETAELALQEAAQRQLKIEEYQNVLKKATNLRDDERKSIEKEIAKLKLEATGYLVLANEIANATNQFERFRATANSSETDTYMDAQSALKMIEDVMYNMESEFYGQFGNERFQEAIKLLINPEFDFENGDVEAEVSKYIDTIRRYFSEGTEDNPQTTRSNMGSFFGDLLENNFAWVDEKGFGHITGTVEDMAEALGITKDAARAALQQLEMFSQARFDWEEIDPEYAARLAEQQEILNQKAAELQEKAAEAQQKAADLQKAAEEAAQAYDQAKDGQDAQAAEEAKAKADAAKQAADEAAKVAKQAVADAEKATAEATGETTSGVEDLQQSLEDITSKINDIKTNGIEIPTENAIQSAEDVRAKLQEIYDLVLKIKGAWSVPGGGAGNNNPGSEGTAAGSVPTREYPVGVKFIASAGMSDVNYANSDGTLNVQKLAAQFIPEDYDGNVDLTRRVVVPVKMLADVGWTAYDENGSEVDLSTESGWATLFTNTITAGDIESGYDMKYNQNVVVNATPILANGDPLEPDVFYSYIEGLLQESTATGKSIKELDAEGYNIVLSVDVVEEGEDVDGAIEKYSEKAQELHDLQEEWDSIRFNNNFFGEAETLDPHGVLQSLEGDINSTTESLENLSNTGTEGVDVDTSKGEEHLENLTTEAGDASDAIRNISRNRVTVSVGSALQSLQAIIDKANSAKTALDNLSNASVSSGNAGNKSGKGTARSGEGGAAGAAGILSSAGGRTLVGELGREMVVDVDSGRWYTVGNHGPEFVNLPKRAIVYSNDRTEELLGTKPLSVMGISMAAGNAGTGNNSGVIGGGKINVGALTSSVEETKKSSGKTAAATEEVAEEAENVLDTIKDGFDQIIGLLEHQIEHAEFEYFHQERALDYRGMINSLSGEAEIYRRIYEEAMKGVNELVAAGATDADEQVQELEETAWDAYRSMKEAIDDARELVKDALKEEVDDIQKAYKTLSDAADEYNDGGKISIDTFQNLMDNGLEYLNLLQDENGSLTVNKDAVNNLTNARKEQLAIETALSYISRLREALQEKETETVKSLVDSTNDLSGSTWGMVYANLALAKSEGLTQAQYDTALKNIDNLRKLTAIATDDVTESLEDRAGALKDAFEKLNQELDHYIAHQEQAYREGERAWSFDKMETALQNEVAYYRRAATEAQNAIHEMERLGLDDTNESLQAMEEALWSATNSMYDTVDKLRALRVDALGNEIDKLSNAYGTLKTASEEYSESGKMSVGTFQSILENGVQYLTLLEKENGQYVISKDRLQEYIQARKEQLAIETALKYISEVREAAENGETERVARLVDATNGLSKGTWDLVYAQAALLKETGLSSEQYNRVLENINTLRDLAQNVETDLTNAEADITEAYQDQLDALDDILKYTEDLIRAETKDHIDAIKKEIEAYKEIIQLKKDSLKQTKEESDYQDEVADKVKEIAQLQARADLLALDTSRAANAERQKLLQDIQNKQAELGKYQADHAYDAQVEALDKEAEAYEASRQEEIETLEASISSEEKVYQLAIARIREQWDTLYQDLIAWNTEQGSVINQEITDAWNSALKAVEKYGSYLAALSGLQTDLSGANANGQLVVADIPKYHGGGVAGDKGRLNDEEVLAVLQKGELVVDKEQKKGLYTVIDFVKTLGERLGTTIGNLRNLKVNGQMIPAYAGAVEPAAAGIVENNNISFNPTFSVNINGDVGDPSSAMAYGRTLAETAANSLFDAFNRRGINVLNTLRQ